KDEVRLELVPERLRGETAAFDIKVKNKVIVEADRRVTARHIRELEKAGIKELVVPSDYLVGKTVAHNVVDTESGEVIANANDELTPEMVTRIMASKIKVLRTLYTNDLDHGPYISNTLRIDPSRNDL